ncbi:hypothetical protein GCM10010341_89290 [Streptomyces noursei]|nr:hypothetical protein GCM10010341_89290 [Streptomyces noursei]
MCRPLRHDRRAGGRRRYGDREVLAAIIFVATTGRIWRQLSPVFGPSGPTAHRRFTEWTTARVWAKLHRVILDEMGSRGDLDYLILPGCLPRRCQRGPRGHMGTLRPTSA